MILSKIWLPYFALATKSISLRTENDQLVLGPKTESKKKNIKNYYNFFKYNFSK